MAEATKRCGFQVISDGTPRGTKVYYQPEQGERVEINCCTHFSMKMDPENAYYDITLTGELLGLDLTVDREQIQVTHDVLPKAPVWVPQEPKPLQLLEAMSLEEFKGCIKTMERQPIRSCVFPDVTDDNAADVIPYFAKYSTEEAHQLAVEKGYTDQTLEELTEQVHRETRIEKEHATPSSYWKLR